MDIKKLYKVFKSSAGVSTDTRNIFKNCIFFCLTGDKFDGNKFAGEALQKGAKYVVIDDPKLENSSFIKVDDSLKSLQRLAKYHRSKLKNTTIIGLTGSNGKTTTKELFHYVLSSKFKTVSTLGNLNNHIGVPLSILRIAENAKFAVLEMGANHIGEIDFLTKLVQPDHGYITNFGKAHLEGFGSFDGVVKGKTELYNWINNNNKKTFINGDDPIQRKFINDNSVVFGQNEKCNFSFKLLKNEFVHVEYNKVKIKSNLFGMYNSYNVMSAISLGLFFGIEIKKIKKAIENYKQKNNRSQIINTVDKKIILDAYNANPTSMKLSIENFLKLKGKKLLILGDMFELGTYSSKEHKHIISLIEEKKDLKAFLVGNEFFQHKKESEFLTFFRTKNCLVEAINNTKVKEKLVLIKGSRSMKMEELIDSI